MFPRTHWLRFMLADRMAAEHRLRLQRRQAALADMEHELPPSFQPLPGEECNPTAQQLSAPLYAGECLHIISGPPLGQHHPA